MAELNLPTAMDLFENSVNIVTSAISKSKNTHEAYMTIIAALGLFIEIAAKTPEDQEKLICGVEKKLRTKPETPENLKNLVREYVIEVTAEARAEEAILSGASQ